MTSYIITILNDSSATGATFAQGINDAGDVVGYYVNNSGADTAFTYSAGVFATYNTPSSGTSQFGVSTAEGINDSDEIVGSGTWVLYSNWPPPAEVERVWNTGFLANFSGSQWQAVNQPSSYAYGVNRAGAVVGYFTENNVATGFLGVDEFTDISYSGAVGTYAHGINDENEIVGYFIGTDPNQPGVSTAHGFFYNAGAYAYFDDPDAINGTYSQGINDADQVAGYYIDGNGHANGFVFNQPTGTYTTVDVSDATNTYVTGINNNGQLVGYYTDGSGTHGFVATPPNPGPPSATTADMIMTDGSGDYEIYDIGGNAIQAAYLLGQAPASLTFAALGTFQAGDVSDMLLSNASTGAFEAYYVSGNSITGSALVGTVGTNWNFAGTGDFDSQSTLSELLLRNSASGSFELYQVAGGGSLSGSSVAAVGNNFTVKGFGHFSESSTTQMMMQGNSGAAVGQLELYTYNPSGAAFAGVDVGMVGSNLTFIGCADLLGNGSTQMIMQQNNGDLWLYTYNASENALSGQEVGAVGSNFHVVGFGPLGASGQDEMLMQDASGDFEVYQYNASLNAFVGNSMGAVGAPWVVGGIAASTGASGASAASTELLVQAMASMVSSPSVSTPGSSAVSAEMPSSVLLTTPQHA